MQQRRVSIFLTTMILCYAITEGQLIFVRMDRDRLLEENRKLDTEVKHLQYMINHGCIQPEEIQ